MGGISNEKMESVKVWKGLEVSGDHRYSVVIVAKGEEKGPNI